MYIINKLNELFMIEQKGYTAEQFERCDDDIFKYTTDYSRVDFLLEQYNHLKRISEVLPENTPNRLRWEIKNNPFNHYGYFMEYIEDAKPVEEKHMPQVIQCIERISEIESDVEIPEFNTYIKYVKHVFLENSHLYEFQEFSILIEKYISLLEDNELFYNMHTSICHGDFTVDNLLVNSADKVIMIDCIYKPNMWSSWLMDIAKFYQNIYFDNVNLSITFTQHIEKLYKGKLPYSRLILGLMIANYVRMFPYIKNRPHLFMKRYNEFKILLRSI